MKAGGKAKFIYLPSSINELKSAVSELRETNERFMLLGNGSNTLFSDEGYDGAVIITSKINNITVQGQRLTAACGASLNSVAQCAADHSLSGLEFVFGIPGTVGGGVYMNAGAYCGELSDCFVQALCLAPDSKEKLLTSKDMSFGYRKSVLSDNEYILLNASFDLKNGNSGDIKANMDNYMRLRREKQPLEYPSCGSTFKRPDGCYAGVLIEQCGLKGYSIGGAAVSEKHAGFVINKSNASADDIIKLIEYVSERVFEKTGIRLEPEVRIIRG
jgi:UDP-N-acetylmuramate dehydrogenase